MFADRKAAGEALAKELVASAPENPLVLALPRGGVPVALAVADVLNARLDLLLVRKISMPDQPELAAGAVVDGAVHEVVFNHEILRRMGLDESDFDDAIRDKLEEIEARRERWMGNRAPEPVSGRNVIVVDDGIATGATIRAALKALKKSGAAHILLAVPVAPPEVLEELEPLVDKVLCLNTPRPFYAVGAHYEDFRQVNSAVVSELLRSFDEKTGEEK